MKEGIYECMYEYRKKGRKERRNKRIIERLRLKNIREGLENVNVYVIKHIYPCVIAE